MVQGDVSDNISGMPGAGPAVFDAYTTELVDAGKPLTEDAMKALYVRWFTETLPAKSAKKQLAEYLKAYKIEHELSRFTADIKKEAIKSFKPDTTQDKDEAYALTYYAEMHALLYMLTTEEEGKQYGFTLGKPTTDTRVDWANVIQFQEELEMMDEEIEDIDILDDL